MSCIAGIVRLDGVHVDKALLERMNHSMKRRAPDASYVWSSGGVGFGHAMLLIPPVSRDRHQPCTLDDQVWITADARIDGRAELIQSLRSAGRSVLADAPDVELILHAYAAFGAEFLDHLIGDFAFALWDARTQKLICARDHFGVRPFYFARTDTMLVFASDIDALRMSPAVSGALDDTAVGDFLLFGVYLDPGLTIYRDIKCLSPASSLHFGSEGLRVQRYWNIPTNTEVRYKNKADYVDRFKELFKQAVIDRMGEGPLALELSGGMDCTSIASIAVSHAALSGQSLKAFTMTCDGLFPEDDEPYYTKKVADYLSLSLFCDPVENYSLFERFDSPELETAQPTSNPSLAQHHDHFIRIGQSGARVLLSGQGGDGVLGNSNRYYARLLRQGRYSKLVGEIFDHYCHTGTLAGMGLRSALMPSKRHPPWKPDFPTWLNEDFALRMKLRERWDYFWQLLHTGSDTRRQLRMPWVSRTFLDYEVLNLPVVVRHPFYDVRLIKYLLGLPSFIKRDKWILRQAMYERLPSSVLSRAKTSLPGDLVRTKLAQGQTKIALEIKQSMLNNCYINSDQYQNSYSCYKELKLESTWMSALLLQPVTFNNWLTQHRKAINLNGKMMMEQKNMNSASLNTKFVKRPYNAPALLVFGQVAALTRANSGTCKSDNPTCESGLGANMRA